jgi:hypothetical protein
MDGWVDGQVKELQPTQLIAQCIFNFFRDDGDAGTRAHMHSRAHTCTHIPVVITSDYIYIYIYKTI